MAMVPGSAPSAFFSTLAPKTLIPPHTGVTNARLVVHVPLIVPPGCWFRVGNERREWKPGEALIFDDTIEHEAWNGSDELRAVLIFDVWNPYLDEKERALVCELLAGVRDYYAQE
jgi:aspartyl/asparaginyl beta-hydroxylase (cupin superfamily)